MQKRLQSAHHAYTSAVSGSAASTDDEAFAFARLAIADSEALEDIDELAQEIGLSRFPNDLTRLLYLASLRDCNSGLYFHPQIAARMAPGPAERLFFACHDGIFRRLLATPVSDFVHQLEEYIRYTKTEKDAVLRSWQSLKAYRSAVPMQAASHYCELFSLNVEIAIKILES